MSHETAEPSPEDVLDYDDIRAIIEDGDVVLFRGDIPTSRIIETVSGGVYSAPPTLAHR